MILAKIFTVIGILTMDAVPLPEQEVTVVSGNGKRVIGYCTTNAGGQFECKCAADEPKEADLIIKIRTDSFAVITTKKIQPEDNRYEISLRSSDYKKITLSSAAASTDTSVIRFSVSPVAVKGIASYLAPWFEKSGDGSVSVAYYGTIIKAPGSFVIYVAAGEYIVAATQEKLYDEHLVSSKKEQGWTGAVQGRKDTASIAKPQPLRHAESGRRELKLIADKKIKKVRQGYKLEITAPVKLAIK